MPIADCCSNVLQGKTVAVALAAPPVLQSKNLWLLSQFVVPANLQATALPANYFTTAHATGLLVTGSYVPKGTAQPLCLGTALRSC